MTQFHRHHLLYWVGEFPLKINIHLEPQNVTLFGNRVFADVTIKDLEMIPYWM